MSSIELGPMLGSGKAYSSREGITLILPGTGDRDGNSQFTRGYDPLGMVELVRKVTVGEIRRTRETIRLWADYPDPVVSVRQCSTGVFAITVWGGVAK